MKICVMTLGCKVNKYESDALIYNLRLQGYDATDKLGVADIYVINTCAVTKEAEKKSRQMIARCRKYNPKAKIFVCGCASQHNKKQFLEKGVDFVSGVAGKIKIASHLASHSKRIWSLPKDYEDDMIAQPSRMRAYIKIQDGCNNFCSYCIIPYLRGRSRSRAIISILNEVALLPEDIKEIVLTGINVTDYKIDGMPALLTLLEQLDPFGKRLRLSSMEESLVSEEFVAGVHKLKNFCPHFHLSLQSGSASVLKRMNRKYTPEEFFASVERIRKYFPYAGITTDVIVGFPGETDEEFEETVKFIKKVKFSSLHIFQYSERSGTVASKTMKDLPANIKQKRFERLEEVKKQLQLEFFKKVKNAHVLVEEKEGDYFVGYSENYIKCYISSKEDLIGKILPVKIGKPYGEGVYAKIGQQKSKKS